jgi:alpha-beta hydrolase superfamily lysophospholipase
VLYVSKAQAERLVVFVHGFRGRAIDTWQRFPESGRTSEWWRASDMLFVGYDSVRDTITGVAARLRRELPRFYPDVPNDLLTIGDASVRPTSSKPYRELLLVGHSLGGVVVRRALCDVARGWFEERETEPDADRPALLDAQVRLFSPASAGFRSAGWLGMTQASLLWRALNMYLRRSSAYTDLQPNSPFLADTRRRTEELVAARRNDLAALRASILWANPDDVVLAEGYDSDHVEDSVDNTTHSKVCKPSAAYRAPWVFVETGHHQ